MAATSVDIVAVMPVLIWLHSKKHDEKVPYGQWHVAWGTMATLLYGEGSRALLAIEHQVHDAIGIPTDNCQCEVCHA